MSNHLRRFGLIAGLILIASLAPSAQLRVVPIDEEQGHVALGLALRHLGNTGIFMHTTAHPDDENSGLLVMLNRGHGYRTTLATATRGNGGQNEIGPEIFEALGVLRTEELAAVHRFDAAEQYFTRAVDFGYSFSVEETFEKWGRDEILADYVRLIRMIRPDVVIALPPSGAGGGQHHQASAVLTHEAVKIAGDGTKFPEQLTDGLRPWQPKKFYFSAGFGFPGEPPPTGKVTRVDMAMYDPLLGKTYQEIGAEARSMHKCQGMPQLLALPGPASAAYQLAETTIPGQMQRDERSLFDGVDTSIMSLAQFAGARPPKELVDGLSVIAGSVQIAQKKFDTDTDESTIQPLLTGLRGVRTLRAQLRAMSINDSGKYEIEFRLRQKEGEFQQALVVAGGVRVEALADDGVVVPGQAVNVSLIVANQGMPDVTVKQVKFDGFDGDAACSLTQVTAQIGFGFGGRGGRSAAPAAPAPPVSALRKDTVAHCEPTLKIRANARASEPYWHRNGEDGRYSFDEDAPFGLPFRPTPFNAQVTLGYPGGEEVIHSLPVQHRYEGNIFSGEKRSELLIVPALSVRITPQIAIVPAISVLASQGPGRGRSSDRPTPSDRPASPSTPRPTALARAAEREIRVTVFNGSPDAIDSVVRLEVPQGWTSTPAHRAVKLSRPDESQTVRFVVRPAAKTEPGEYRVSALVDAGGQTFDRGYQVIEYPHIRRRHIYDSADTTIKIINVRTAPNLTVGYIMGVGDQVPAAIEQLGAKLEFITPDDLAWGDLSRFDTIVTGVRAYERRDDLRANNNRLLEYVRNGGALIVQYNKFEFNEAQYGPYPAKVSSNRVADESSPVQLLAPTNPVFTTPNEINEMTWKGWVQERGLYFLSEEHDPHYRDLVQLADPFPYNQGPKLGALVETTYGKGRWIYVGLGLWRELPSGVDGAYQILANLISLGKAPAERSSR